jgi:hypothetical protein
MRAEVVLRPTAQLCVELFTYLVPRLNVARRQDFSDRVLSLLRLFLDGPAPPVSVSVLTRGVQSERYSQESVGIFRLRFRLIERQPKLGWSSRPSSAPGLDRVSVVRMTKSSPFPRSHDLPRLGGGSASPIFFRGLLRFHSRYGRLAAQPLHACDTASTRPVAQPRCSSATGPIDLSGWILPPLVIRALGAHTSLTMLGDRQRYRSRGTEPKPQRHALTPPMQRYILEL